MPARIRLPPRPDARPYFRCCRRLSSRSSTMRTAPAAAAIRIGVMALRDLYNPRASRARTRGHKPMKAVVIREHGDESVLRLEDRPRPVPAADEVLVRVQAVGLNHLDL